MNQSTPKAESRALIVPALMLVAVVCLVGLLVVGARLVELDGRMQAACSGCQGIVRLELAFSADAARTMLEQWGESGRAAALESLRLDTWFIVCYVGCIVALAVLPSRLAGAGGASTRLGALIGSWTRAGGWVAGGAALAGLLDLVENRALLQCAAEPELAGDQLLLIAGLSASIKLALVIPAGLYAALALVMIVRAVRRRTPMMAGGLNHSA